MDAKKQPDVLGELFQDKQVWASVPGLEELDALIHACVTPCSEKSGAEKKLLPLQRKNQAKKVKATHYLQEKTFAELDEVHLALKELLPEGSKLRASKSRLVNYAVRRLLQEIETKGADSPLVQYILDK